MSSEVAGRVVSVNVGRPRVVEWAGRRVTTAIWKAPVDGPVTVAGVNLDGDDQADRRVHGGPDKAIYAYAREDYEWWSQRLGAPLAPGTFGENLTLEGIDLHASAIGETWEIGTARLRVSQPRFPCFKLGIRMGDSGFVDTFAAARRFGSYLAIEQPGIVSAGDTARRLDRPGPGDEPTIGQFIAANEDHDVELLRRLAAHPLVPEAWRRHAESALRRASKAPLP